jgi:sec-independent protein translocase protein TatA
MGEGLLQPTHLIIILVIVMIVFGAGKLPEIGGAMGRSIKEFKQSVNGDSTDTSLGTGVSTAASAPKSSISPRPQELPGARADEL